MNEQLPSQQQVSSDQIITMIEQFIGCLNYPNTKAALTKEKKMYSPNNNGNNVQCNQEEHNQKVKENVVMEEQGQSKNMMIKMKGEQANQMINQNRQIIQEQQGELNRKDQTKQAKIQEKQAQLVSVERKPKQFTWKAEQAKFYSKFASFSEIVYCLETSSTQRQLVDFKIRQNQLKSTSNQVLQNSIDKKPTLLHLFSAFDTISKVKQYVVPIYRNLCLQPKFSKLTRFLRSSPKQGFLCIVDQASNLVIVNLYQKCIVQFMKPQEGERITAINWLKSGLMLVVGTSSGKLTVYSLPQNRSLQKLATLQPHTSQIATIFSTRQYIYTCSTDFSISRIVTRYLKLEHTTKLKNNWFKNIVKIEHKKLKDNMIFGIEKQGKQVIMIDQNTGLQSVLFDVGRDHIRGAYCEKWLNKREDKLGYQATVRACHITDMLVNSDNNTLIISVSGISPSIYQIDPLRNQFNLRLNHRSLKCPFMPLQFQSSSSTSTSTSASTSNQSASSSNPFTTSFNKNKSSTFSNMSPSLHMSLSHKSQLLCITTNSNTIFYVLLKNWRILHEFVQSGKNYSFGAVTATRRYVQPQEINSSLLMFQGDSCNSNSSNLGVKGSQRSSLLSVALDNQERIAMMMDMEYQKQKQKLISSSKKKQSKRQKSQQKQRQRESYRQRQRQRQLLRQKQSIICVHNQQTNNIQIYYNVKTQMKTIRSDNIRARPFLSSALGFPNSAQGFLELLQTIRENYQNLV